MKTLNGPLLVGLALSLSACVSTKQQASIEFRPPQGSYSVIVIEPDISVGLVTAGGEIEQRQDWTDQARENVKRRGRAVSTVVDGKLYLMLLEGTASHYFDAALPEFQSLVASATIS
jgi:hypothetical protein